MSLNYKIVTILFITQCVMTGALLKLSLLIYFLSQFHETLSAKKSEEMLVSVTGLLKRDTFSLTDCNMPPLEL